ncbi:MAG: 50S ribosomal protein L19 [Patescibacteria group bacterium]
MAQYFKYKTQEIASGDTVRVHQEVVEDKKKRIQIFEGLVIAIKGSGNGKSFTVRRIGAGNIGVEKILPVMMPSIKKIEVKRKGQVRRARLYYLRDKVGKKASKVKEKNTHKPAAKAA